MKKHLFAAAILAMAISPASWGKEKDPVLMTVDGRNVPASEFEYLYNKNNTQQQQQQSIDEYLQMFIDYRLKVADALHEGMQNKPEFVNEFGKYRSELAAPYMRSQAVEDQLVDEAYSHRLNDVYVSHIMLPPEAGAEAKLDSIRTAIIEGKTTFEAAARANSVDRPSAVRGGRMGYVIPDRFPWPFEKAAYELSVGEISPVVNSGLGYHLIRVESIEPTKGQVHAAHILRSLRGKSPEAAAAEKALIDSLYTALKGGADFAKAAQQYSEDPGSARDGGDLGFFSRGMMVAEFDSVAFALADGEISKPLRSNFGYHIVYRLGHKDLASKDEMRQQLITNMTRDERAHTPEEARIAEYLVEYKATPNAKGIAQMRQIIEKCGGLDSIAIAEIMGIKAPAATFKGGKISFADVMPRVPATLAMDAEADAANVEHTISEVLRDHVLEAVRDDLADQYPDYRNLVNEYHDGILYFEISNKNVWDRAAKDREGLEAYFKANAGKYRWEQPKFKSYVIFATSDSILAEATAYADSLTISDPQQFVQDMRAHFGRDVKVERVIAAKGENAITDFLAFGGDKPAENNSKWKAYAAYKGRILDAPEEASDVRGAAVTDFQKQLDEQWVAELRKKYEVKVNQKVFDSLKKKQK